MALNITSRTSKPTTHSLHFLNVSNFHYRNSIPSLTLIPHSDISGQLTATSPNSSSGSSGSGSAQKGGALGMPAVSGGLVGAVVAAVAFVGGIARVIA